MTWVAEAKRYPHSYPRFTRRLRGNMKRKRSARASILGHDAKVRDDYRPGLMKDGDLTQARAAGWKPEWTPGVPPGRAAEAQESTLADPVLTLAQVEKLLQARPAAAPDPGHAVLVARVDALQRRINKLEQAVRAATQPVVFELSLQPKRVDEDEDDY